MHTGPGQEPRQVEHAQIRRAAPFRRLRAWGDGPALTGLSSLAREAAAAAHSSSAPGMPRSRLIARAVASAASSVGARQVTCPILRPRRGSALPYRWSFAPGCRSTSRPFRLARRGASFGEPDVTQQVHHHRGLVLPRVAERQAREHARLLLELRGDAARRSCNGRCCAGAGAISLTTSAALRRHEHLHAQHAAVVELRRDGGCDVARFRRERAGTRAGTIDTSRMPSRCRFSATGHVDVSPSSVRATTTETSAAERHEPLDDAGTPSHRAPCACDVARATPPGSAPCRRSPCARSSRSREAALASTRRASSSVLQHRVGRDARIRVADRNAFSRIRSCAMATLSAAGLTRAVLREELERRSPARSRTRSSRRARVRRARRDPADRA